MGVSGTGKSTLASALATALRWEFIEADDFHSPQNKDHMRAGLPLTNAMRAPWFDSICKYLNQLRTDNQSAVMAFSGLLSAHRARLRTLGFRTVFIHLQGDKALIAHRIASRENHFMSPMLIDSQFHALQSTRKEQDVHSVACQQPPEQIEQLSLTLINMELDPSMAAKISTIKTFND